MKLLYQNFDTVWWHEGLKAHFTIHFVKKDERIYCLDCKKPRKVYKGSYYFAPIFFYEWCNNWIPSGCWSSKNMRRLSKAEEEAFRILYND